MIVCHCRAVSDRVIRARIRQGATTLGALTAETGASNCCGGCEPTVSKILHEELGLGDSSVRETSYRPLRVVRAA